MENSAKNSHRLSKVPGLHDGVFISRWKVVLSPGLPRLFVTSLARPGDDLCLANNDTECSPPSKALVGLSPGLFVCLFFMSRSPTLAPCRPSSQLPSCWLNWRAKSELLCLCQEQTNLLDLLYNMCDSCPLNPSHN